MILGRSRGFLICTPMSFHSYVHPSAHRARQIRSRIFLDSACSTHRVEVLFTCHLLFRLCRRSAGLSTPTTIPPSRASLLDLSCDIQYKELRSFKKFTEDNHYVKSTHGPTLPKFNRRCSPRITLPILLELLNNPLVQNTLISDHIVPRNHRFVTKIEELAKEALYVVIEATDLPSGLQVIGAANLTISNNVISH